MRLLSCVRTARHVKGTQLRSDRVTHLTFFFESLYFLVTDVISVSKHILWSLNMSTIHSATLFITGMYLLNREKRY